eukprot:gnl/Trimastix_PCT/3310.p1 GENE.gnl/Trimastix_PCT/3310~~gnl/Trimastix_PCT/3310.p1  ORF type:complete len:225 (+),score=7.41 gnl/Trimastix_PCT/3310:44-718(+)
MQNIWERCDIETNGHLPSCCHASVLAPDQSSFVILSGTSSKSRERRTFRRALLFQIEPSKWIDLPIFLQEPDICIERGDSSAILHEETIFLFGGTNYRDMFNDVLYARYSQETLIWHRLPTFKMIPPKCRGHTAHVLSQLGALGTMAVYGGATKTNDLIDRFSLLDLETGQWTSVAPPRGASDKWPVGRVFHAGCTLASAAPHTNVQHGAPGERSILIHGGGGQ